MTDSQRSIPQELEAFFSSPGGHSLVVRGEAGTGKTTLALHIIETMSMYDRCFYFSTRVSDYLLLRQFPWLGGSLYGEDLDEWIKNQSPLVRGAAADLRTGTQGEAAQGRNEHVRRRPELAEAFVRGEDQ